jgi:hypothetical protein
LLAGGGYFLKETLIRLWEDHLDLQDIETQRAEIAWVYDVGCLEGLS